MINLKLFGNKAFQWIQKDNHFFTGYFFDENNEIYKGNDAIDYLLHIENEHAVTPKMSGIYTCIKTTANGIEIITDSLNYFPVFYLKQNEDWLVSDDWNYLIENKGGIKPNLAAEAEFQSIGFVLAHETLDKDILKTRSGEKILLYHDGTYERVADFHFLPEYFTNDGFEKLKNDLKTELYEAGKRLLKFLDARTAVVPLSGGFDSRLIACLLKKLNYENVVCFTYGIKNKEEEISRKVAQALGYKWYFIDYSEIELDTYLEDTELLDYMKFVGNGYAMPYLQEYFAVQKLVKERLIPENSVFLPGHIGGLAGAQILKSVKTKKQNHELFHNLINNYFFFKKIAKEKDQLIQRINETTKNYPSKNNYSKEYNPYIEDWLLKEKFSKFIFHSSKVFDFWKHETYFVLWDKKLVDFFRAVPFRFRENKWLYDEVAVNDFFAPLQVYFQKEEMSVTLWDISIQKIKSKIRNFVPWKYISKRMKTHDWMYYAAFTSIMENRMEKKGYKRVTYFKSYNAIICRWYLDFVNFYKPF